VLNGYRWARELNHETGKWGDTGSFPRVGKFVNGVFTIALDSCLVERSRLHQLFDKLGWIMPGDVDLAPGGWEHHLYCYVMPLRIYEAYKWRIGA